MQLQFAERDGGSRRQKVDLDYWGCCGRAETSYFSMRFLGWDAKRHDFFQWREYVRLRSLKESFDVWKHGDDQEGEDEWTFEDALIQMGKAYLVHRQLGKAVSRRIRAENDHFFRTLADRLSPKFQRCSWQELKRYLPRYSGRKRTYKAAQLQSLAGGWEKHLCKLEAGEPISFTELYEECLGTQNNRKATRCGFADVPTLLEVEDTLRATRPNKAADWTTLNLLTLSLLKW